MNTTPKQLTEEDVKAIVRKMTDDNYTSGTPRVPLHRHDGIANIAVSQKDLIPNLTFAGSITFARSDTYTLNLNSKARNISFNGTALNGLASNTTVTFVGGFSVGATIGILNTIWGGSTGNKDLSFSSGEDRSALFTNGSLTVSWTAPLTRISSQTATIGGATIRALVVGSAQLGPGYYFQPLTTSSVAPGGAIQGVLQSSSMMLVDTSSVALTKTKVSQFHLVYVPDSTGAILAQATVGILFNQGDRTTLSGTTQIQITTVLAPNWEIIGNLIVS